MTQASADQTDLGRDDIDVHVCTRNAFVRGFRRTLPISVGNIAWGITFGVLAQGSGIADSSTLLMSVVVFSGTAQIIAVEMLQGRAGILAIWGTTLLVSLRYVLIGLTMRGWFRGTPRWLFWPGIHFTGDQSWALALAEVQQGRRDAGFFFGSNTALLVMWLTGTAVGLFTGGWLADDRWGLHFTATAALVGILGEMEVRRSDVLPWLVAAVSAIAAQALIGGYWYMLIGVFGGLMVALVQELAR